MSEPVFNVRADSKEIAAIFESAVATTAVGETIYAIVTALEEGP